MQKTISDLKAFDEDHLSAKATVTGVCFKPGAGTCSCGAPIDRYWVIHVDGKTVICLACHQNKGEAHAEPDFQGA
jgi:hypothetical protein